MQQFGFPLAFNHVLVIPNLLEFEDIPLTGIVKLCQENEKMNLSKRPVVVLCIGCLMVIMCFSGNKSPVLAQDSVSFIPADLSVSADGTRAAVVMRSTSEPVGYVEVLNTSDFQSVAHIEEQDTLIYAAALNADGTRLAVHGGTEGNIRIFDLDSGEYVQKEYIPSGSYAENLLWNPGGEQLAAAEDGRMSITEDLELLHTLPVGEGSYLSSMAWSPDGLRLATSISMFTPDSAEGKGLLQIWELSAQPEEMDTPTLEIPILPYSILAWNSDGTEVANLQLDGIHLYEAVSGEEVLYIPLDAESGGMSLALHPEDTSVAVGSPGFVRVWSLPDGELIKTIEVPGADGMQALVDYVFWLDDRLMYDGYDGIYVDGEPVFLHQAGDS
jgi:WD40 repeat protein